MLKLANRIEHINTVLGTVLSWATFAIVLLMFWNVLQRYFLATNHVWQTELVLLLHSLIFLTLAGHTLKTDRHIRVDLIYSKLNETQQAWINLAGTILFLVPTAILISYFSYDFISNAWAIKESSREANGLSIIYVMKGFIYIFSTTLLLQSTVTLIHSSHCIFVKK